MKRLRVLIFALCVLMPFCWAYPQSDSPGEIHFLFSNLALEGFENVDHGNLVMDPPAQAKGIIPASFLIPGRWEIHLSTDSFPFQPISFEQGTFAIRC